MNIWDQLVDCICRPPRDVYSPAELLGGSRETFAIGAMECTRLDYELTNQQGMKLQCSHYFPLDARSADGKLPVVVYCHCNSGSRRDAEEAVYHLLPCGVGVVAFDFTGSGLSDGKWVTLGAHEVEDLGVVVRHLRSQGGVSSIGLWGRSMGAVTALLYSHSDPDIAGMVLDSPFSRLTDLMLEIVVSQRLPIPKMMLKLALRLMRNSVRRKAGCDINTVSPLDVVPRSAIPAMFGHGEEDSFINMQHSVKLYEAYNTAAEVPVYKNLVRFRGDHNHPRPSFFYSSVCCFFHQQLRLDQVLLGGNPADTQQLLQYGSLTLSSAHEALLDRANGFINTPWSLDPVSALTPADEAAAAAAAAALLAEEGPAGGSGSSSSSPADRISSPPRLAVASKGAAKGSGAVVHISEGGLNSPRARAGQDRAGRALVAVDAGASSSGSSGGGMGARNPAAAAAGAGAAAGARHGSRGGMEGQQHGLGQPGSPISPSEQQRHHSNRHRHHPHQQQQHPHQQRQQRCFSSLEDMVEGQPLQQQPGYQPDRSWQLASAMPVPASAAAAGRGGTAPACPSDALFSVGSRGAYDAVLGAPQAPAADAAGAAGGGRQGLSKSAPGAAAAFAAAGGAGGLPDQLPAACRPSSRTDRGASPAGGPAAGAAGAAAGAAGGQHFKWLFKRNGSGSSGGGSTPSTSPPATAGAAAAGVAVLQRPRSRSAGVSAHSNGHRADADHPAAGPQPRAAAAAAVAGSEQQPHGSTSEQRLQQQAHGQRQHSRGTNSAGGLSAAAAGGALAAGAAGATAVSAAHPDAEAASWRANLLALDATGEEELTDPDIAAAIAASLADQQQQQQQSAGPQQPGQEPQRKGPSRQPSTLEEEEDMLRQAIALSLALAEPTAQGQPHQQQQPPQEQQEHLPLQEPVAADEQQEQRAGSLPTDA